MDRYAEEAKRKWGHTDAYKESQEKDSLRTEEEKARVYSDFMGIFAEFGRLVGTDPGSEEAQRLVAKLKEYITQHFYSCTDTILAGLGQMYTAPGEMHDNIDGYATRGTADFAARAIEIYCKNR